MAMDATLQGVAAALASFFVITLIFAVIFIVCRSKEQRRRNPNENNRPRNRTTRTVPNPVPSSSITIGESQLFDPTLTQIDMEELVNATRNFSADLIVGDGSFGLVYKANLSNGVTVAVKKLAADAFQGFREFLAEMETLGKIRHQNIVKILGYCATGVDRILIYEFIEKGSIDQWLYDTSSPEEDAETLTNPRLALTWHTRINIIKGVANGLSFMHKLETPIIHRDIKASNVLLDSNFEAHIADFGLARRIEGSHSHVSTQVAGTMGYMPPEYIHGSTVATVMGDIYSFGILMFEIATGRRPNWPLKDDNGKEIRLVEWATAMVSQNRQMEMVDPSISREELKESEVVEFFKIATSCTNELPKYRHSMDEVLNLLDGLSR